MPGSGGRAGVRRPQRRGVLPPWVFTPGAGQGPRGPRRLLPGPVAAVAGGTNEIHPVTLYLPRNTETAVVACAATLLCFHAICVALVGMCGCLERGLYHYGHAVVLLCSGDGDGDGETWRDKRWQAYREVRHRA